MAEIPTDKHHYDSASDGDDMPARKRSRKNMTINEYDSESEDENNINSDGDEITEPNDKNIITKEEFNAENEIEDANDENGDISKFEDGVEAFNMDQEMSSGQFDKQGNYIPTQQDNVVDSQQEEWIDSVKNVQKVAQAHKTQVNSMKKRERQIIKNRRKYMLNEALLRLLYCVENEETVLEALSRFNSMRRKATDDIVISTITNSITLLTDLIDLLEKKDIDDVYDLTRSKIKKLIEEESLPGTVIDNQKDKNWSFKWISGSQKIHEFYSNYEMNYWKDTYFNNKVIVKYKDEEDISKNWLHVSCITFM
ncbi:hypothetical protein MOUN0_O00782 [Monosporozyma unispora]|nr:hypothetical protein C6P44_001920 [Kazachstania unispora]